MRHLAFAVDDVAACKAELEAKGVAVEPIRVDEYTGRRFTFFADPDGLPLELYCFTNTTAWARYEAIQSDIFDHLLAILPEFGLRVFQEPSGVDFARLSSPRTLKEWERRETTTPPSMS